jgi:uncharacterized protein YjiS (DUF1127 family)
MLDEYRQQRRRRAGRFELQELSGPVICGIALTYP